MEELLERLLEECRPTAMQGQVADYIPELAKGNPEALGIYNNGERRKTELGVGLSADLYHSEHRQAHLVASGVSGQRGLVCYEPGGNGGHRKAV